jgi:hypothetical protein
MEMTAIEWLVEQLTPMNWTTEYMLEYNKDIIEQAKEMEKQHIVKAAATAYEDMFGTDGTEYGQKYYEKLTQDDK